MGLREYGPVNPPLRQPQPPLLIQHTAVELVCHPATPCAAQLTVSVALSTQRSANAWRLQLTYRVNGEIQKIKSPPAAISGPVDGLWTHTCFEAFFAEPAELAYREFNFSPSTEWAHYRFTSERQRDPDATPLLPPVVSAPSIHGAHFSLTAAVACVPWPQNVAAPRCAVTAVLELMDGSLSYWAAHHPAPLPDFHSREGWRVAQPAAIA